MYLSIKPKKTSKEHRVLLLVSTIVVATLMYALLQGYKHVTLSNVVQSKVKDRVVVLQINPAPKKKKIVKKEVVKKEVVKKEVVKKEVVKNEIEKEKIVKKPKETPKPIKKELVKQEPKKQEVVKETMPEVIKEELVQKETVEEEVYEIEQEAEPVFDEEAKESFIAGLYELLNENKRYPKMAKRRKLEGVCEVSFTLSKDGKIKDVFLKKACGHSILDTAALKVVRSVEFYKPIPDAVSLNSLHLNIPIKYARN